MSDKNIIPIPWKFSPIPPSIDPQTAVVLASKMPEASRFCCFIIGTYTADYVIKHWPIAVSMPVWCTLDEYNKAMQSMMPDPSLPSIIKPKWADTVGLEPTSAIDPRAYKVEAHTPWKPLGCHRGFVVGPECETKREAIEEWNKLMSN